MYNWFRQNQQRLSAEYLAIRELAEACDWLKDVVWDVDGNTLFLTATVRAHGYDYPIRMDYPLFFPDSPPIVRPQDPEAKWTSHAYRNGVLCLEWGPDNWHSHLTGAQMLESAYRLLDYENPLGSDQPSVAPSRHQLTVGQELRHEHGRFYLGESLLNCLKTIPIKGIGTIRFSLQVQKSITVFVHAIHLVNEDNPFEEEVLPKGIRKAKTHKGLFLKANLKASVLTRLDQSDTLRDIFASFCRESSLGLEEQDIVGWLIVDEKDHPHAFLLYGDDQSEMLKLGYIKSDPSPPQRVPSELEAIADKRIGIVGLGSVGSKIALSLARTGVSRFLLVDHDVFLPENLCRNVLDWRDVGEHKVEAVKARLSFFSPDINVDVSKLHLTGQESTTVINNLLHDLTQCDLLIDATASPAVFSLLASIAKHSDKPLVWMEVYAGGVGGMVARSRPGIDPPPLIMQNAYEESIDEVGFPETSAVADYLTESTSGVVMVATDADVSVIAGHATRLALDTLLGKTPSLFPYSMYLIGLAGGGFFEQPFDVRPIDTQHLSHKREVEQQPIEIIPEVAAFVKEILNREIGKSASF